VIEAVRNGDQSVVAEELKSVAIVLRSLVALLKRVGERLEPRFFYGRVRPFFAGSGSLPGGLVYETGNEDDKKEAKRYTGGSAVQSSLFQFCDIVLGVEHGESTAGMLKHMWSYMPRNHRQLLEDAAGVANVRGFVRESGDGRVKDAYQSCLEALKGFRDVHIGIVTRYIVVPSKKEAAGKGGEASISGEGEGESKGTGGTPVMPFLKTMRDETAA
jgi:indoleamine 2,3-dioxygenase